MHHYCKRQQTSPFKGQIKAGSSGPGFFTSLKFTPEFIGATFKCIEHLETLGKVLFNYSIGESMQLALDKYLTSKEMMGILDGYRDDNRLFGDLYCQFIGAL